MNFLIDDGRDHIVLICKELVDGLFGDTQLGSDLIHGDGTNAIPEEEVRRLA
jgi:hypothetical protein